MTEFEKLQELTLKSIIGLTERMQAQDKKIDSLTKGLDSFIEECARLKSYAEDQKKERIKAEASVRRERLKYKELEEKSRIDEDKYCGGYVNCINILFQFIADQHGIDQVKSLAKQIDQAISDLNKATNNYYYEVEMEGYIEECIEDGDFEKKNGNE